MRALRRVACCLMLLTSKCAIAGVCKGFWLPLQALSFDEHTPPADAGDAWRAEADRFQHGVVSTDVLQLVVNTLPSMLTRRSGRAATAPGRHMMLSADRAPVAAEA